MVGMRQQRNLGVPQGTQWVLLVLQVQLPLMAAFVAILSMVEMVVLVLVKLCRSQSLGYLLADYRL